MKKLRKITVGFVVQEYVLVGDTLECVGQEFVAGDDVSWEDESDSAVDTPIDHVYQPFVMEQPEVSPEVEELRRVEKRGFVVDPGNWFE